MSEAIRLFVGADGTNCDLESQMVLEYSVRKYASRAVDIVWMQQAESGPWSGWKCDRGRTPFSNFRWSVPSVCGYQGKAIYCDSDFVFLADIAELWDQPVPKVCLVRKTTGKLSTSCMLFDCQKAKGHVPDLAELRKMPDAHGTVLGHFRSHKELVSAFSGNWDCYELCKDRKGSVKIDDPNIKAIHYTRISSQLHLKYALPRLKKEGRAHWYTGEVLPHARPEAQALFDALYADALSAGYSVEQYRVKPFADAKRRAFVYSSENKR